MKCFLKRLKPEFDVRLRYSDFETFEDKNNERNKRIRMLLVTDTKWARKLAKKLEKCKKYNRCWISACPVCMRRLRIWLCGEELRLLAKGDDVRFVTIVITDELKTSEALFELSVHKLRNRLRTQLRRAGLGGARIIGGFELDYNYHLKLWIPHFHLLILGSTAEARKEFRDRYYQPTEEIHRPMMDLDIRSGEKAKTFSYCLKSFSKPKKHPAWEKRLDLEEHNLSLRFFSQYKPQNLVFIRGGTRRGENILPIKNGKIVSEGN
jgi:hypothetical protein